MMKNNKEAVESELLNTDHQKQLDSFNDHQKDNRGRATLLANYVFVLAGACFTASITVFSSRPKEQITPAIVELIHSSWLSLFISVISFLAVIAIMIFRDYIFAELTWRRDLSRKRRYLEEDSPAYATVDAALLVCGLIGICTFTHGLYALIGAATLLIS